MAKIYYQDDADITRLKGKTVAILIRDYRPEPHFLLRATIQPSKMKILAGTSGRHMLWPTTGPSGTNIVSVDSFQARCRQDERASWMIEGIQAVEVKPIFGEDATPRDRQTLILADAMVPKLYPDERWIALSELQEIFSPVSFHPALAFLLLIAEASPGAASLIAR